MGLAYSVQLLLPAEKRMIEAYQEMGEISDNFQYQCPC